MRVMDEVCITLLECDVVVLPLVLLRGPLVHTMNISERPQLRFSNVSFLGPTRFTSKIRSPKDCPDFLWGLCLRGIILRPRPSAIDIILGVHVVNELFNFILKCDILLRGITNVLVVSTILVLIPFRAVSK